MELFAIIALFVVLAIAFRVNNAKKIKKRKDEDKFLQSIDYVNRIPEVKTKPKRGIRRSKEEINSDNKAYQKLLGEDCRKKGKAIQIKAERIGSKSYIWHGSDCCPECDKQDGKKYAWAKPPKTGHPGEGRICPNGHCRCWAEVVVPPPKR